MISRLKKSKKASRQKSQHTKDTKNLIHSHNTNSKKPETRQEVRGGAAWRPAKQGGFAGAYREVFTASAKQHYLSPPKPPTSTPKNQQSALLLQLHNLIQQKLTANPIDLPDSISPHPIKLSFTLLPNGTITNILIIKSSGIAYLDQHILNIIQNPIPLKIQPSPSTKSHQLTITVFAQK